MTKYVAEILKQLGINYEDYRIENHRDEGSGETWITLHPKSDLSAESNLADRINKLSESAFGKYKIIWDENSCYLNVLGELEINSNGVQLFPLPTNEKPAIFSQDYILKTWKEYKDTETSPNYCGDQNNGVIKEEEKRELPKKLEPYEKFIRAFACVWGRNPCEED